MVQYPVVFLIVFAILLTGCQRESPQRQNTTNVLVLREKENPRTLDPALATRTFESHLARLLHGGLVRTDSDGNVVPELVADWVVSSSPPAIEFQLYEGLSFPDGTPISAADVKYSWERVCQGATLSPWGWLFEDIVGWDQITSGQTTQLAGLVAASSLVLKVRLKQPSGVFLARMTMPAAGIVSATSIAQAGSDYGRKPSGCGAWLLEQWQDDVSIRLHPNPVHPCRNQNLAGLEYRIIPQEFSAFALYQTGHLDVLNPVSSTLLPVCLETPHLKKQVLFVPQLNTYYLGMNNQRPPLDQIAIRQLIAATLEKMDLAKTIFGNQVTAAQGPVPPALLEGFDPKKLVSPVALRSVEKGRLQPLELWFVSSDAPTEAVMEGVQYALQQVGFDIILKRVDATTYHTKRRQGVFDLFLANWWADYPDPDNFVSSLFLSDSDSNHSRFSNPECDRLIYAAQSEFATEQRAGKYATISQLLREQAPVAFLWHRNDAVLKQKWVEQYSPPIIYHGTLYSNEKLCDH